MEADISEFWQKNSIFRRSIEERPESRTFVFYDGPPFATGLPHTGHLLQSSLKDAVPRYRTMQGDRVPRRWGWDCHGLPMEAHIQKELKLKSRGDVEAFGIGEFNKACANAVAQYAGEWKRYIGRIGRWVEFDGAYKTMDPDFIESVWWAFAELWKKGFVYKDLRVSLYSPSNGTPLSNFEVAMENSYVDAEDPSVTLKFAVEGEESVFFLAWTTTPWTLPANVALAVHPTESYVRAKMPTGEAFIVAEARAAAVLGEGFEVVGKMSGSDLVGMAYAPLFPMSDEALAAVTAKEGATRWKVVAMDYVSMNDGTGIVHTAPAFGEEDFQAARTHGLPVLLTVDEVGVQKSTVPVVGGMPYLESNPAVLTDLRGRNLLFKEETIVHSVATFARDKTRLMYRAQPAWYVDVQKIKPKMLETAKKIRWQPDHLKEGRFGKGLETAPDWCISRSRFWGAPIPVWTNADGTDVQAFGSFAELEAASGRKIDRKDTLALHLPRIDEIVFANAKGEEMRRIPEVFDCWFESGSMPYASAHYPAEGKAEFEAHFPGDFIAEGQDQTRGWFYSLHVLSSALFGKPAFQNVICTGLLMAEDGRKMSKSLKNYADPFELMEKYGADSLRTYLLASPMLQAESVDFSEKDVETIQRNVFGTLWNVRAFYGMYAAEPVEIVKPRSMHVLDRWLMARLHKTIGTMTEAMDRYDVAAAVREIRPWVDDLSTWWLRRSRDRIKSENAYERQDALRTLREALLETAALLAPFAPFFAEKLYQDLEGSKMSVHLDRWPKADERVVDLQLLADMELVRAAATAGHEARVSAKMPVRQALASATVRFAAAATADRLGQRQEFASVLRDELNVEEVRFLPSEGTLETPWIVVLDTQLTTELKRKGLRREVVRHIMQLRKDAGLVPADRAVVFLHVPDLAVRDEVERLVEGLAGEAKAERLEVIVDALPADVLKEAVVDLGERKVALALKKV